MAIQWHPLFTYLLRPLVSESYEVLTNIAVGDIPREADLVLLRRKDAVPLSFRGIWKHLTRWNVLEYKGPTVTPRTNDLDLLIELGLGIHRRMNENYSKQKRHRTPENEFSIWFLASRIGKTFHSQAARRLGGLNQIDEGIWRSQILDRYLFFVSGVDLPVDHDSVPFHILGVETAKKEEEAASLIANDEMLWEMYSQFLGSLHSSTLKELIAMAKTARNGPKFQIKPLVEFMGMQETITQIGEDQVLDHFASDPKRMKKALAFFLNRLSNSEREEIRRKLK